MKVHWDNLIPGFAALIAGVGLLHSSTSADPAPTAPAQASGAALLAQAAQTLRDANTLTAAFSEEESYPTPYKDLALRGTVELARPGRLRVDIKRYRRVTSRDQWAPSGNDAISVSDGTTYTYAFLHPHSTQVRRQAEAAPVLRRALAPAVVLEGFFDLATDPTAGDARAPVTLLSSTTWEGHSYSVVEYPVDARDGAYEAQAFIGDDHLVHRLIFQAKTADGLITKEWTLRNIRLNAPVAGKSFAYEPPADATPIARGDSASLLAAGSVAPDFEVTDVDGKRVRLSDYRGKTVVLDFWATWCWPCNQSLPGTDALVRADRDKGVVALAVAIWDSRKGFDAWNRKHSYPDIRFAFDPRPQGKDAGSALYHVSATPTAYVIGPDGKVAGSQAGFSGSHDQLEAAIRSATGASPVVAAR